MAGLPNPAVLPKRPPATTLRVPSIATLRRLHTKQAMRRAMVVALTVPQCAGDMPVKTAAVTSHNAWLPARFDLPLMSAADEAAHLFSLSALGTRRMSSLR